MHTLTPYDAIFVALRSYTAKNHKLLKTVCNNVVGATLFNVVNNIVQPCCCRLIQAQQYC